MIQVTWSHKCVNFVIVAKKLLSATLTIFAKCCFHRLVGYAWSLELVEEVPRHI